MLEDRGLQKRGARTGDRAAIQHCARKCWITGISVSPLPVYSPRWDATGGPGSVSTDPVWTATPDHSLGIGWSARPSAASGQGPVVSLRQGAGEQLGSLFVTTASFRNGRPRGAVLNKPARSILAAPRPGVSGRGE